MESNYDESFDNFDNMSLKEDLLRGIYAYGFEKPSAIQQRAIVPLAKGHDLIAQAQSGTGKTATFTIGILQQIDLTVPECQVRDMFLCKNFKVIFLKFLFLLGTCFGSNS